MEGSMVSIRRRTLLGAALAACASAPLAVAATPEPTKFRLGIILGIAPDPDAAIAHVREFGLPTCQVHVSSTDAAISARLRAALDKYQIEATAAVFSGPGKEVYDFYQGPETIGVVPRATRAARIAHMKAVADFAQRAGIPAIQGHCGFIPENPNDPLYKETVDAIREVALYCKAKNLNLRCETGQETPITLIRTILDTGADNIGVNFDPANLVMYGKANAAEAARLFGSYIQGVHAKDGAPPSPQDPRHLGEEVPIGHGLVDWPLLIQRLREARYSGPLTIEREISGEKQTEDILRSIDYLNELMI